MEECSQIAIKPIKHSSIIIFYFIHVKSVRKAWEKEQTKEENKRRNKLRFFITENLGHVLENSKTEEDKTEISCNCFSIAKADKEDERGKKNNPMK